jgi:hypothetical protein
VEGRTAEGAKAQFQGFLGSGWQVSTSTAFPTNLLPSNKHMRARRTHTLRWPSPQSGTALACISVSRNVGTSMGRSCDAHWTRQFPGGHPPQPHASIGNEMVTILTSKLSVTWRLDSCTPLGASVGRSTELSALAPRLDTRCSRDGCAGLAAAPSRPSALRYSFTPPAPRTCRGRGNGSMSSEVGYSSQWCER